MPVSQISRLPGLVKLLLSRYLEITASAAAINDAAGSAGSAAPSTPSLTHLQLAIQTLRLFRAIAASGRAVAKNLLLAGWLDCGKRFLVLHEADAGAAGATNLATLQKEVLLCWRAAMQYGHDVEDFTAMVGPLRTQPWLHTQVWTPEPTAAAATSAQSTCTPSPQLACVFYPHNNCSFTSSPQLQALHWV